MTLAAIVSRLDTLIWKTSLAPLPRWQGWLIRMLRILIATGRDIRGGLPTLRAMGLVYTTLLSLVPLLAVSFSVLKGFGVHNQVEPALLNRLDREESSGDWSEYTSATGGRCPTGGSPEAWRRASMPAEPLLHA